MKRIRLYIIIGKLIKLYNIKLGELIELYMKMDGQLGLYIKMNMWLKTNKTI
jgi:hypothetical protein